MITRSQSKGVPKKSDNMKPPISSMPHRNESTPITRVKSPKRNNQQQITQTKKVVAPPKKDIITTPTPKPVVVKGNMWKPPPNARLLKRDPPHEKFVSQEPIKIDLASKISNLMVLISLKKLVKTSFVKSHKSWNS